MSDKDFAISVTATPAIGHISKKPNYLISLEDKIKGKSVVRYFITLDKPDLLNDFIAAKGFYSDLEEEDLSKRFGEVLANTPKTSIVDMMFPAHRVLSIKNLVFNAQKQSTLVK